jgi:hypothetical protein
MAVQSRFVEKAKIFSWHTLYQFFRCNLIDWVSHTIKITNYIYPVFDIWVLACVNHTSFTPDYEFPYGEFISASILALHSSVQIQYCAQTSLNMATETTNTSGNDL